MPTPPLQPDKLAKLKLILDTLKEDTVSSKQLTALLAPIVAVVQQAITNSKSTAQQSQQIASDAQETFQSGLKTLQALLDASDAKLSAKAQSVLDKAQTALDEAMAVEDGYTPVKGVDYFDGEPGKAGNDGSPDTGEQIVQKINDLPTDDDQLKIDAAHIRNLPQNVQNLVRQGVGGVRNITVYDESTVISKALCFLKFAGAGVQATVTSDGVVVVTVPGGSGTAADEAATDSGDHTTFTISHTPTANTLLVINENTGQAVPASAYTNTTTSIIFNASQQVDDGAGNLVTPTFRARYFY